MKYTIAAAAAITLALAAPTASAGVVISQELTASNQAAGQKTDQTVMIQGHQQKIVTDDQEVITDLDAGKMYLIKPKEKQFIQISFPPATIAEKIAARQQGFLPEMKKATETHQVAGYACQDYRGVAPVAQITIFVTECVASAAPGAKEYLDYRKAMAAKLKGTAMGLRGEIPDGIPVSTISVRRVNPFNPPPGFPPDQAAKIKAAMAKNKPLINTITVTKIEVKDLPAETFTVPPNYIEQQRKAQQSKEMIGTHLGAAPGAQASSSMPAAPAAPPAPAAPAPH